MNITDQDRDAAREFLKHGVLDNIIAATAEAFAAHRLRGYNAGLEAAAKVAETKSGYPTLESDAIRAMIEGETE